MSKLAQLSLGAFVLLPLAANSQEAMLPYKNQGAIARGQVIYADNCASCHGVKLEGEANWRERDTDGYLPAPPHDETGHTWHHPDAQLFMLTKKGTEAIVGQGYKSRMPGFEETLSDTDIIDVLAFIKSTWSARIQDIHNRRNGR
jgi:mono/diheme cytochrome c family protein